MIVEHVLPKSSRILDELKLSVVMIYENLWRPINPKTYVNGVASRSLVLSDHMHARWHIPQLDHGDP